VLPAPCTEDGCKNLVKARGLCAKHWKRWRNHGDTKFVGYRGRQRKHDFCTIEDCEKAHLANGYCQMHNRRYYLYGDPMHKQITGDKSPAKYKQLSAPWHPNANADGNIFEHRLVMSEMIGRPLVKGENVHHKNGDGFDNKPENLELWNTVQPAGQRPSDKVEYAIQILKLYAPELLAENEA
jgi:hypothetical protein